MRIQESLLSSTPQDGTNVRQAAAALSEPTRPEPPFLRLAALKQWELLLFYSKFNASIVTKLPFKFLEGAYAEMKDVTKNRKDRHWKGKKKEKGQERGGKERATDLFSMAIPYDKGLTHNTLSSTAAQNPSGKAACWRRLIPEVIPGSPYLKHSVNDQFQTISNCRHKVTRKNVCLTQLTNQLFTEPSRQQPAFRVCS